MRFNQARLARPIVVLALMLLASVSLSLPRSARADSTSLQLPHSPILINNDNGFNLENGVTGGSGTSDDPYTISGWDILAGDYGIMIANTTSYFTISSVSVSCAPTTAPCADGIVLSNIVNGIVQDSQITVREDGVKVDNSNNFQIKGNEIQYENLPISLYNSDSFDVSNNSLQGGSWTIKGSYMSNASIVGNTGGAEDGITLDNISGLLISQNSIRARVPIAVLSCGNLTIDNNTATAFDDGIAVSDCSNVLVSNNKASNIPYGSGISIGESTNIGITSNTVSYDENGMIFDSNAAGNSINSNSITNNQCGVAGPETVFQDNAFYNNTFNSNNNEFCPTSGVDAPWPGFHQNPQHTGISPFRGPSTPALRWKFQTGGGITSSPAVAYGRIYVGSNDGNLYALNLEGVLLWKFSTPSPIRTTPAVGSDGTIYVEIDDPPPTGSCADGLNKCLVALNPDGTIEWGLYSFGEFNSPAVGSDGTIYIDSTAFNPNGTIQWQDQQAFNSPSLGSDGTIYGTTEGSLNAVNPDGTVQWQFPLEKGRGTCLSPDCSTINYIFVQESSVAIGSDGILYFGSGVTNVTNGPGGSSSYGSGNLSAVNPDGTLAWSLGLGSCGPCSINYAVSDPAIGSDGTIYVGSSDGNLYAIGGP